MDLIIPAEFLDGILWCFLVLAGALIALTVVAIVMLAFAKPINAALANVGPTEEKGVHPCGD